MTVPTPFVKMVKGKLLYSTVANTLDCSMHFLVYSPGRPVQLNTISTYLPLCNLYAMTVYIQISTTVFSQVLIYIAEWTGAMQSYNLPKVWHTNTVLLVESPKLQPLCNYVCIIVLDGSVLVIGSPCHSSHQVSLNCEVLTINLMCKDHKAKL